MASRPTGDPESPSPAAPLLGNNAASGGRTQTQTQTTATTTTVVGKALSSTADLAKHLPIDGRRAGFEFLSSTFTADGRCTAANRALTGCHIAACALSCFVLSFTDSFRDDAAGGIVRYGFVTPSGRLRLIDGSAGAPPREARYRLGARDVLHGLLSFVVFLAVAMVDINVVACFYLVELDAARQMLAAVPMAAGAAGSFLFAMFPSTRRGIGFPTS